MSGLEQTFYTMGIIFMSLTFIMIIVLVVAVLVIRQKINRIHDNIEAKVDAVTSIVETGGELSAIAGKTVVKKAKKALKNATK